MRSELPRITVLDVRGGKSLDKEQLCLLDCAAIAADDWYGVESIGYENHRHRIRSRSALIVLAIDQLDQIAGVSYLRPDGKRGALSVSPKYRGLGLSKALIEASLLTMPFQYTELPADAPGLHTLFLECGFHRVADWKLADALLNDLRVLVVSKSSGKELTYVRKSGHDLQRVRNYSMWVSPRQS